MTSRILRKTIPDQVQVEAFEFPIGQVVMICHRHPAVIRGSCGSANRCVWHSAPFGIPPHLASRPIWHRGLLTCFNFLSVEESS